MAVQFIFFNFASNSPSIAMDLKLLVNDTSRDLRQTNLSPEHYF